MHDIYRVFVLICVTIIVLVGFSKDVTAKHGKPLELAQLAQISESANQRVLEVALPESATVRLTAGGSYTGELTAFNSTHLTLSANSYSETVPLAQVQQVEFQGDVWIRNADGVIRLGPVRGYPVTFNRVPVAALELADSSSIGRLNLNNVLNDEEFARLSRDTDRIHAVTKILFESSDVMEVTVKAVPT
ncbi:MAG: hypothetical protein Kow00121_26700 [Elainellaceae cyanobacterium]